MNPIDEELIAAALEVDGLSDGAREAFEDMRAKGHDLKPNQRAWLQASLDGQNYEPPAEYENISSSGRMVRGREVPTPEVLRNLPKRPPGRTA